MSADEAPPPRHLARHLARRLRSRDWFDNPERMDMTAL